MKKRLLFIMIVSLLVFSCSAIPVNAYEIEPFIANPEISTYIETKIVVSYAFTQNITSEAYSAGKSVWHDEKSPLSASFTTSAADRFTWQLTILYTMVVDQVLTIAIFSGDEPVDSWTYPVKTDKIILDFDISVTAQPKYPTAEELADKSIEVLGNELAEYVAEMRRQNELTRQHATMQWIVCGIAFAGFVGYVTIPFLKRRPEEEK